MTALSIFAILISILVAGFYAGVEMGFYRLNRLRLAFRVKQRRRDAVWLADCVKQPDPFVVMALVAQNLFVFVATFLCTRMLEPSWGERAEVLSTLVLVVPLFVFGEVVPKEAIGRAADTAMYHFWAALAFSERLFRPGVWLVVRLQRFWRIFPRYRAVAPESEVERHRLEYFLGEGAKEGTLSAYQHAMAANIMKLRARKVEGVMVPRASVVSLAVGQTLDECRAAARSNRHRRFPVADEQGRLIGVVNILDVLAWDIDGFDLREHLRRPVVLRRDDSVIDALHRLRRGGVPLGLVEDEKGDVVGIVTLKDLIEEIVGDLGAW